MLEYLAKIVSYCKMLDPVRAKMKGFGDLFIVIRDATQDMTVESVRKILLDPELPESSKNAHRNTTRTSLDEAFSSIQIFLLPRPCCPPEHMVNYFEFGDAFTATIAMETFPAFASGINRLRQSIEEKFRQPLLFNGHPAPAPVLMDYVEQVLHNSNRNAGFLLLPSYIEQAEQRYIEQEAELANNRIEEMLADVNGYMPTNPATLEAQLRAQCTPSLMLFNTRVGVYETNNLVQRHRNQLQALIEERIEKIVSLNRDIVCSIASEAAALVKQQVEAVLKGIDIQLIQDMESQINALNVNGLYDEILTYYTKGNGFEEKALLWVIKVFGLAGTPGREHSMTFLVNSRRKATELTESLNYYHDLLTQNYQRKDAEIRNTHAQQIAIAVDAFNTFIYSEACQCDWNIVENVLENTLRACEELKDQALGRAHQASARILEIMTEKRTTHRKILNYIADFSQKLLDEALIYDTKKNILDRLQTTLNEDLLAISANDDWFKGQADYFTIYHPINDYANALISLNNENKTLSDEELFNEFVDGLKEREINWKRASATVVGMANPVNIEKGRFVPIFEAAVRFCYNNVVLREDCPPPPDNNLYVFQGYKPINVLALVWNVARTHPHRDTIVDILAECIVHETCLNGRCGKYIEALRGFFDLGQDKASGTAFQFAFCAKIVNKYHDSMEEKMQAAIELCDEYYVRGLERDQWLAKVLTLTTIGSAPLTT